MGPAAAGGDTREVVIGISPAFGIKLFQTVAGHPLSTILRELIAGITEGGASARVVRMKHTADTSFLGLSAASLAGSGVGIGIQAKGTAVIHQKDRLPHNNLELFSNSPITRLEHYRRMGANAAAYARGELPEPVVVPMRGEAMGSRYHARVALIYAIETELTSRRRRAGGGCARLLGRRRMSGERLTIADYPLAEKRPRSCAESVAKASTRSRWALIENRVALEDLRITATALRQQAEIARAAGRDTLAENFERGAELVDVPQDTIMRIYELLRPGRAKSTEALVRGGTRTARAIRRRRHGRVLRGGRRGSTRRAGLFKRRF